MSVVSHHGTDDPADVDGVSSQGEVTVFVPEVLWAELQELQTSLQDPRLILHTCKHTFNILPLNKHTSDSL